MKSTSKYRIYAKIIGYILPKEKLKIGDCFIVTMTQEEQKNRHFSPLAVKNPESIVTTDYKSFLIPVRTSDSRIIKSQIVTYTDISYPDLGGVLGVAIGRFDRLVVSLSLSASSLFERKHNRYLFKPYDYQICKIYQIVNDKEKEVDEDKIFFGGSVSQINLPIENNFDEEGKDLINRIYKTDIYTVSKSLEYFLEARRLFHQGFLLDKVILDLAKSVEVLTKIFTGRYFPNRLESMSKTIGLSNEIKKDILKLWKKRNKEDVAHADLFDQRGYLPPQFPIPSRTNFQSDAFDIVSQTILKFFIFFHGIVQVKVRRKAEFGKMNNIVRVNNQDIFIFNSDEKNKIKLTIALKKKLASTLSKTPRDIKMVQNNFPELLLKVKDYRREDYKGAGIIQIFGSRNI